MTRAVVVTRDAYRTEEMKRIGLTARKNSVELIVVDPTRTSLDVSSGRPLDRRGRPIDFDVALGRVDADCLEAGSLYLQLIEGIRPVINGAKTFRTGRDKRAMSRALARAQIPHPRVWSLTPHDAFRLAHQLPYPLVVKPARGSLGRGVALIKEPRGLARLAKEAQDPLYLQEYRPVRAELRLLVLDGRVLGAIRRLPRSGEWRANLALGGMAESVTVQEPWSELAVKAAAAVAADFAGIDLALTDEGPVVLEVNVCPGFLGFSRATGIDVAQHLVHALHRRNREGGRDHEGARAHPRQIASPGN